MKLPAHPPFSFQPLANASDTVARWKTEGHSMDSNPGRIPSIPPNAVSLAIHHEEKNAFLGLVHLAAGNERQTIHLFLWIAPPFRQNGYATEVGKQLMEWAWDEGFERLETAHPMDTPGAGRLVERLGWLPEGVQRGAFRGPKGRVDLAHWGLLRTDR